MTPKEMRRFNEVTPPPGSVPARGWPRWITAAIGVTAILTGIAVFTAVRGGDEAATTALPAGVPITTPVQTPAEEPTGPPAGLVLGASCSYDPEGYGIDYPQGWFAATDDPAWACQLFDPQPFTVLPDTEPPIVAVRVYVERHPLDEVLAALADTSFYRVISSEAGTFSDAQRPGRILETEQIEEGLFPAGTQTFSVLVDRANTTIVVATNDLAATDYASNQEIVRAMAASLRIAG